MMIIRWALRLSIALALLASTALAQGPAQALLDEGIALREHGRDEEALGRFQRAYQLAPSAQALAQIGLAEQALGRWVQAEEHVSGAIAQGGSWINAQRQPMQAALSVIRSHLGTLELIGGLAGAEIRVNGERAGTLPLRAPLHIEAGTASVEIIAPGQLPFRRSVEISAGGLARLNVALVAGGASEPLFPARASGGSAELFEILGLSAIGAAMVGGILALGFYFERERNAGLWNDNTLCIPAGGGTRDHNCSAYGGAAGDNEGGAIVSLIAGGVMGVAGAVLLIMGLTGQAPGASDTRVACGPGPGTIGAACGGRF